MRATETGSSDTASSQAHRVASRASNGTTRRALERRGRDALTKGPKTTRSAYHVPAPTAQRCPNVPAQWHIGRTADRDPARISEAHGGTNTCYSPTQNLSIAYEVGAKGCACKSGIDVDVCVQGVALMCKGGFWIAVDDGPCMQIPPKTYSPTACTAAGGIPVASPGSPITAEKDCASGMALGIIDFASSGWDEGGLCCAPQTTGKACGTRAGNTCSTKEYCAYVEGEFCGQADAEATCKPRPNACDDIYQPVCGCDGKTYGNSCAAATAGIGVYSGGTCK